MRGLRIALASAVAGALLAPGSPLAAGGGPGAAGPDSPPADAAVAAPQAPAPAPAAPANEAGSAPAPYEWDAEAAKSEPDARAPVRERAGADPVVRAAAAASVTIRNFVFQPATVNISVGDTVTWTNQDEEPHTATGNGGSFNTGTLEKGESGSHTFSSAGRFAYICAIHPNMNGTVVVAGSGGSGSSGSGSSGGGAADDPSASTAAAGGSGGSLPQTGVQALAILIVGASLMVSGALLRLGVPRPERRGE
jgi:plastocyanin